MSQGPRKHLLGPTMSLTMNVEHFLPWASSDSTVNSSKQPAIIISTQGYHSCYCGVWRRAQIDAIFEWEEQEKKKNTLSDPWHWAKLFYACILRRLVTRNCFSFELWRSFRKPICTSMLFAWAFIWVKGNVKLKPWALCALVSLISKSNGY